MPNAHPANKVSPPRVLVTDIGGKEPEKTLRRLLVRKKHGEGLCVETTLDFPPSREPLFYHALPSHPGSTPVLHYMLAELEARDLARVLTLFGCNCGPTVVRGRLRFYIGTQR